MSGPVTHRIFEWSILIAGISGISLMLLLFVQFVANWRAKGSGRVSVVSRITLSIVISASVLSVSASLIWFSGHEELSASMETPKPVHAALHMFLAPVEGAISRWHDWYHIQQLAALEPIDAHTHITATSPEFVAMLDRLHMHVLDILYVDDTSTSRSSLEMQRDAALVFIASSHGRGALCTTFDPFRFRDPDFASKAIESVNHDFQNGAVAVKVWKNVGLELRDYSGRYVMPDDPAFAPIYRDIAELSKTLILHAAEEDSAWTAAYQSGESKSYFEAHPQWDMSKRPDAPSKPYVLHARDEVVRNNPDLRVIGAHFGGLVNNLDELSAILDRYPNFAVDISARVRKVALEPHDKVRQFFLRYQDRILYGTDLTYSPDGLSAPPDRWQEQYLFDWRYFSSNDIIAMNGHQAQGLDLPPTVLKKLYHDNAIRWIPGIVASQK